MKISRNNSFNTLLSAVFIDKISGPPTPLEGVQCTFCKSAQYADYMAPSAAAEQFSNGNETIETLWRDITDTTSAPCLNGSFTAKRLLCYRALSAIEKKPGVLPEQYQQLMSWWRRAIPTETDEDRIAFLPAMKAIYSAETLVYPDIKNIH